MHSNSFYRLSSILRKVGIQLILSICSVACVLPLILVISASFSSEKSIALQGYSFFPRDFTTFAYDYIFKQPEQILRAYGVTTFVTIVGTFISLLIMSLLAYVISRTDFKYRKSLSFYVFFTMLFNGGLVPWYIMITQYLHLKDSIWVLILPYLVVPWFVLLLRTFFSQIPVELLDAARIDGAGEWRIFFQIVIPLSTPALATVGLFIALMYWNDWWLPLLFIDNRNLHNLQYLLYSILTNIQVLASNPQTTGIQTPVATVRMAMAILATGPAALAFLLTQRYLVKGITIGALK